MTNCVILVAALLTAGRCLAQDVTGIVLPATLHWTVTTNWIAAGQVRTLMGWTGDKDPNITTYFERGDITSNLIATVTWKGTSSSVVVETIQVGTAKRSYTISEPKRVYNP